MNKKIYNDEQNNYRNMRGTSSKKYLNEEYKKKLDKRDKKRLWHYINGYRKELIETMALKYKYTLAAHHYISTGEGISDNLLQYIVAKSLWPHKEMNKVDNLSIADINIMNEIENHANGIAAICLSKKVSFRDIDTGNDTVLYDFLTAITDKLDHAIRKDIDLLSDVYMNRFKTDVEYGYGIYANVLKCNNSYVIRDMERSQTLLEYTLYKKIKNQRAFKQKELEEELAQQRDELKAQQDIIAQQAEELASQQKEEAVELYSPWVHRVNIFLSITTAALSIYGAYLHSKRSSL